jgi:hypothetical protein
MAEAVGIAAAALQFLSAAHTCLRIFREFKQNTPESQRILGLRLEAEAIKFRKWCEVLGVQSPIEADADDAEHLKASSENAAFQENLRKLLRFDNERLAQLTIIALQDMVESFRKAQVKFAPVASSSSTATTPQRPSTRTSQTGALHWLKKIRVFPSTEDKRGGSSSGNRSNSQTSAIAPVAKPDSHASPRPLAKASGLWVEVRWVALDKKTFKDLLKDISAINDCLRTFLSDDAKIKIGRRVEADILRSPQLSATAITDELLPEIPVVRTMAIIKEQVEQEDHGEACTNSSEQESIEPAGAKPSILQVSDFSSGTLGFGPSRSISSLAGRRVLVEWTHYGKEIDLSHFYRRGHLLQLLNDSNAFRRFKTLQPRGMVVDTKDSRIGLVFRVPGNSAAAVQENTLTSLLEKTTRPVGQRFTMASTLATALHSLQTVDWLHKSIRSDNIVYFMDRSRNHDPKAKPEDSVANSIAMHHVSIRDGDRDLVTPDTSPLLELPEIYLLGWNLSRPGDPSELSQTVSISIQGYKLTKEMIRLYSHPDSLPTDGSAERPRFKLEYDIYSFGLVLLELGLWRSLPSLRQECSSDEEFRVKARGYYCDKLLSHMGEIYWRATKCCLNGNFDLKACHVSLSGEQEIPLSVAFERQVVSELETCMA